MEWFKKRVDTIIILTAFGSALLWMNGKFNKIHNQFEAIHEQLYKIVEQLQDIENVLIIEKTIPVELAMTKDTE